MSALALLLIAKIAVTLIFVSGPLLALPQGRIERLSGWTGGLITLFRLYGAATLALLVGYAAGLYELIALERTPWGVLFMGLVSNAGASLAMIATGYAARAPLALGFFGTVAIGLALAIARPEAATAPLWR